MGVTQNLFLPVYMWRVMHSHLVQSGCMFRSIFKHVPADITSGSNTTSSSLFTWPFEPSFTLLSPQHVHCCACCNQVGLVAPLVTGQPLCCAIYFVSMPRPLATVVPMTMFTLARFHRFTRSLRSCIPISHTHTHTHTHTHAVSLCSPIKQKGESFIKRSFYLGLLTCQHAHMRVRIYPLISEPKTSPCCLDIFFLTAPQLMAKA